MVVIIVNKTYPKGQHLAEKLGHLKSMFKIRFSMNKTLWNSWKFLIF